MRLRLLPFFLLNVAGTNDQPGAAAGGAPAAAPAPAAPPAAAPQAPKPSEPDPAWINGRIAQAKTSAERDLLQSLGVTSVDDAKAAIAKAKAAEDADKSSAEKAAELKTKLDAESAENKRLAASVAEYAGRMMLGLTAEQQAAVKAVAGDDAAAQIKTINAMAPTWAAQEKAAAAAAAATSPPAATTSPAPSAPNGATTSQPNHRATYVEMRATDPFAAAKYGAQHPEVYEPKG